MVPTRITLAQACAGGEPEWIRTVWDRMDPESRVKWPRPVFAAAAFHHPEVTKWLTEMHPPWLGRVRRFARERRLFDILAILPEATETLPQFEGVLGAHVDAVERLGIPLALACVKIRSGQAFGPAEDDFEPRKCRVVPSVLLAEVEGGLVIGAFVAIRWPKIRSSATDRWCGSFLFAIDGAEAKRFPAVTPPIIAHSRGKLSVGELALDLAKKEFSIDETCRCTAPPLQFPASAGKLEEWTLYSL
jgi:hypothetical protein